MTSKPNAYRETKFTSLQDFPFSCHMQRVIAAGPVAQPHVHTRIELLYCLSGCQQVTVNQEEFPFRPGDLILINSNAIHAVTALTDEPQAYAVYQFSPELLYAAAPSGAELKYLLPFTMKDAQTQKLFTAAELEGTAVPGLIRSLSEEYETLPFGYELAIRLSIQQLFLWILRRWHDRGLSLELTASDTGRSLAPALDYVWANFSQNITVAQMADLCSMSYSYFSRTFRRFTGQNFVRYLTSVRLLNAKTLLSTTSLSVTEIAMRVGFSGASYFIEQFRCAEGIPPHHYRSLLHRPPEQEQRRSV